ncbi:MAG: tail fiber protein [Terracidiphilus sp.]
MADPFVGQLTLVGFNFNPVGWQLASGQVLPISQYTALFSLLGVQYGGNGTSNFALPNLQGNVPVGAGQGAGLSSYTQGETGGSSTVTLLASETPNHNHACMAKSALSDATTPVGNTLADNKAGNLYTSTATPLTPMAPAALPPFNGGSQPHNNMMPYLGMYWIIAINGVFPARG